MDGKKLKSGKEEKNMKIYNLSVYTNDKGKIVGCCDEQGNVKHPYEYDKEYRNWVNCSGFYTAAQLRYRVKAGKIRWA